MSTQISDILCLAVASFNVLSIQAHLTSRFTPGFSKNLAEKLPQHNRAVFWWLGFSDSALRWVFIMFNTLLTVLLWVPSLREQGLKTAVALLCVGFYSDMKLGESPIPHLLLISLVGGALWLR